MRSTSHHKASHSQHSKVTTNHDQIRKWAEARCGRPATVKETSRPGKAGVLRIDFPDYRGKDTLQEISWDDFFEKFDSSHLAFVYQDKTAGGKTSRFGKLVDRDTVKARTRAR